MKIKLTILLFCLFGFSNFAYAQISDTLLVSLEKKRPDSASVMRLLKAAVQLPDTLFQKKLEYANKALSMSEEIAFKEGMARAYRRLSNVYFFLGEYAQSLDDAYKALQLADDFSDKYFKPTLLQQIGKTHEIQGSFTKAEEYYLKSFDINKASNEEKILAYDYSNLANVKMLQNEYEKSLEYRNEELRLKEKMKDTMGLAFTYNDMSVAFFQQGKYKEGLPYIEKGAKIIEKLPTNFYKSALYLTLAETYLNLGRNIEAEKIAEFHLQESKKLQAKDIAARATSILYQVNYSKKNYQKAYEYLLLNAQLRDSTYNEQRLKEISKMENNFQIKQKQKENELLQKENELKSEEIKIKDAEAATNRLLMLLSGAVLVLLLGVVAIFYRNIQLKKKTNDLLLQKNAEISEQKEEIIAIANDLRSANDAITLKNEEIEEKNQDILASINYAKRIQRAMLPMNSYFETTFGKDNFFILYQPKDIVSGDFYWLATHGETVILAVADCTGHGVPGAFMSMIGNDLLNEIVNLQSIFSPELILQYLNKGVNKVLQQDKTQSRDGMDIAIVNLQKKENTFTELSYAGAMNPLYIVQDTEGTEIKADKKPIGGYHTENEGDRVFNKHHITLKKSQQENPYTTIYLCSDGYQDQFGGAENRKFMVKQLREKLFSIAAQNMAEQQESLQTTFDNWKGNRKQIDDVLVIGLCLSV